MSLEKTLNLKDDEQVLYLAHQFPITLWHHVLFSFALLIAPFFFLFPLFDLGLWGMLIFFVLLVVGLVYGGRQAFKWFYNVFAVTDQRVIDVDQKGFFDRTVSVAPYANIQDVSYRIKGVWQTIFRYGNVLIQTSSAGADLEVRKIRHPHILQELINELRLEIEKLDVETDNVKLEALKEFTDKLTIEEVKTLVKKLKDEEKEKAITELYQQ
jgi:uncharacterized membrane protein YdbT with pleckstrin-like domain